MAGNDPEVKRATSKVLYVSADPGADRAGDQMSPVHRLAEHYSSWHRLKRAVAWLVRLTTLLHRRVSCAAERRTMPQTLTAEEMAKAEKVILEAAQMRAYVEEMSTLVSDSDSHVKKSGSLAKLDPVIYDGLLRVGGRLGAASVGFETKHPVILPKEGRITQLIVEDIRQRAVGHQGREHVLTALRDRFWVVKGTTVVRRVIRDCLQCRRRCAAPMTQKMAPLPEHRLSTDPPFTHSGVDYFGPFFTKRGRALVKVYFVIFTCMSSRAIHLDVADSLSTNSCLSMCYVVSSHAEVMYNPSGRTEVQTSWVENAN